MNIFDSEITEISDFYWFWITPRLKEQKNLIVGFIFSEAYLHTFLKTVTKFSEESSTLSNELFNWPDQKYHNGSFWVEKTSEMGL